jgi:hypothetical protein
MKWTILTLICHFTFGCCSSDLKEIELISFSGRALDYMNTDSLILGIYIQTYAQIDNNGNCIIVRTSYKDDMRFNSFKIEENLLKKIKNRLSNIYSDTLLAEKSEGELYDGPMIQLLVHRDNDSINRLTYINNKRADKDFLKLYRYIDSISKNIKNEKYIDTTKLLCNRDLLIDKIKEDAFRSGNTFDRDTIVIIK